MTIEVMKQALEALCTAVEPKKGKVYARHFEPINCFEIYENAITALRQAIERSKPSEYENGVWTSAHWNDKFFEVLDPHEEGKIVRVYHDYWNEDAPKRQWVGLTEDEREEIALEVPMDAVLMTEAKLKEKNT